MTLIGLSNLARNNKPNSTQHSRKQEQEASSAGNQKELEVGAKLANLLEQLTQIQATFAAPLQADPNSNSSSVNSHQQRLLIESIKVKLAETERTLFGPIQESLQEGGAREGVSPEPSSDRTGKRSNQMRYSTPNLLLSSNFEHILRQQDRVSRVTKPTLPSSFI